MRAAAWAICWRGFYGCFLPERTRMQSGIAHWYDFKLEVSKMSTTVDHIPDIQIILCWLFCKVQQDGFQICAHIISHILPVIFLLQISSSGLELKPILAMVKIMLWELGKLNWSDIVKAFLWQNTWTRQMSKRNGFRYKSNLTNPQ